jgi:selenide, water dikinase
VLQPIRETFSPVDYPELLVGLDRADDAAVYRLNDEQAIVSTTDFFPPIVDDPYDFGAIAAANAMSDIYAMGGQVLFALNLVAFPANLDRAILREILRGGAEKVAEAGAVVVGGHSVDDREPKYGLAVTGIIHPDKVSRKGGAQPGDVLLLTKPLGTGIVTTALKGGSASDEHVAAAVTSMKLLNRAAAEAALAAGAHAMTDITGFGLLGHAQEMASQSGDPESGVDLVFEAGALPWLPGTHDYAAAGYYPGGAGRNQDYFAPFTTFAAKVKPMLQDMLWNPETSGGLLIALPPAAVSGFLDRVPGWQIGYVVPGSGCLQVTA